MSTTVKKDTHFGSQNEAQSQSAVIRCAKLVDDEIAKGLNVSIIRLVDALIERAYVARSSDVHLDPSPHGTVVRLRIDGVLQDVHVIPTDMHHEVISRIKILCGLRTDEHSAAQDGRFRVILQNDSTVDVRVSIVPVYYGENVVFRLLSGEAEVFSLEKLGFNEDQQKKIEAAIKKPYGMVLSTGPTGSGKTTTLYTLIKMLNSKDTAIITIEDPVEYAIGGINQIQVNARTGLTFANGLRSILRQDPNIIMVGEIRDMETAGLAVNTALTGHLVFSTLHTNDAATTLPRLLDMKVEPYLIASTVNLAIGQRLLRRLCSSCKTEKKLTDVEVKSLGEFIPKELVSTSNKMYTCVGCDACNGTGYKGRVGIYEVLVMTNKIREAILRHASSSDIRELAIKEGMVPIVVDGFKKALLGETTVEEVLRMRYE